MLFLFHLLESRKLWSLAATRLFELVGCISKCHIALLGKIIGFHLSYFACFTSHFRNKGFLWSSIMFSLSHFEHRLACLLGGSVIDAINNAYTLLECSINEFLTGINR